MLCDVSRQSNTDQERFGRSDNGNPVSFVCSGFKLFEFLKVTRGFPYLSVFCSTTCPIFSNGVHFSGILKRFWSGVSIEMSR
jgi:hypothetical protein